MFNSGMLVNVWKQKLHKIPPLLETEILTTNAYKDDDVLQFSLQRFNHSMECFNFSWNVKIFFALEYLKLDNVCIYGDIYIHACYAEFVQEHQSEFFYRIFHKGRMFEHKRSFTDKCTVSRLSHTLR